MAREQLSGNYALPEQVRMTLARQAAERASRKSWHFLTPSFAFHRAGIMAAAACVLALLVLPVALRHRAPAPPDGSEITRIDVVSEGGAVRLAWANGEKEFYTVYKSTDPREFARGEAHVVQGNVWTDKEADSSPVVFYKVE
jgi:hypothetical protein